MQPQSPIVVLDSGLGGLTVVRSLRQLLPAEDLIYFGDTARLPYGSKSPTVVTTFVSQIIRYLAPLDPKHIVIACNTATALAMPALRAEFPGLHISGVIEPGADAVCSTLSGQPDPIIGVMATEATVRSQAYEKAILKRLPNARILMQPAPLLVPIIEDGRGPDDPLVNIAIDQYLSPLLSRGVQSLVLGCTHYPILRSLVESKVRSASNHVEVVDSAENCAQDVLDRLKSNGLQKLVQSPTRGSLRCWVTDDGPRFARLASRFLGYDISRPVWISPDELPTHSPVEDSMLQAV